MNASADDPNFLLLPRLLEYKAEATSHRYFVRPTPGSLNGDGILGFAEAPRFSVTRGFHESPFALELTTATPGATSVYTTK